jgi:hypothetical protein
LKCLSENQLDDFCPCLKAGAVAFFTLPWLFKAGFFLPKNFVSQK